MAILKRKNGKYQVRLQSVDGTVLGKTFDTKREAEEQLAMWKMQKRGGAFFSVGSRISVDEYFAKWFETVHHEASQGWRRCQHQFYTAYVHPIIGSSKLKGVNAQHVSRVIGEMARAGKSEQTQLHIYNLMRKMFRDAIDLFQLLTFNPVNPRLKPKVPLKVPNHLNLGQLTKLLFHVRDKEYGSAIWLQAFTGLRVSEVIALKWEDLDLETGVIKICRSYSRKDTWVKKEPVFKDYPKGGKQHAHAIPLELLEYLREIRSRARASSDFVAATSYEGARLSYEYYLESLKRYCLEVEIPQVGTHRLRHSTSELYMAHGATRDDLRQLFAHSSMEITDRYVHNSGNALHRVIQKISLFDPETTQKRRTLQLVENNPAKGGI